MSMAKNYRKTIVIVTYNQSIAKMADLYRRAAMASRRSCPCKSTEDLGLW